MFKKLFKKKSINKKQETTEKEKHEELTSTQKKRDACTCEKCKKLEVSTNSSKEKIGDSQALKHKTDSANQENRKNEKPRSKSNKKRKKSKKDCPNQCNLLEKEVKKVKSRGTTAKSESKSEEQLPVRLKDCKPASPNVPYKDCCVKRNNKKDLEAEKTPTLWNKLISQPSIIGCDVSTKETKWKIDAAKAVRGCNNQEGCESQRASQVSYTWSLNPSEVIRGSNKCSTKDTAVGESFSTSSSRIQQTTSTCCNKKHTIDNKRENKKSVCCDNQRKVKRKTDKKSSACNIGSAKKLKNKDDCGYCHKRSRSSCRKDCYPVCPGDSSGTVGGKYSQSITTCCDTVSNTSIPTILQFFRYKSRVRRRAKKKPYPCRTVSSILRKSSATNSLNSCCFQQSRPKVNRCCGGTPSKKDCCTDCTSIRCCKSSTKVVSVCVGRSSAGVRPRCCSKATICQNHSVKNRNKIKRPVKSTKKIVARGTQCKCKADVQTGGYCGSSKEPVLIFNPSPLLHTVRCN